MDGIHLYKKGLFYTKEKLNIYIFLNNNEKPLVSGIPRSEILLWGSRNPLLYFFNLVIKKKEPVIGNVKRKLAWSIIFFNFCSFTKLSDTFSHILKI